MTRPTVDRDQLAALRMLRSWLGPVEVLEVRGLEGVPGDPSPGLAGQQLALTVDGGERHPDRGSRAAQPARRADP
jgi:hypothetical protein